jgi:hypothetical protein
VLPYRRFLGPWLLGVATRYLNEPRATYRSVVRHNHCQIGYSSSVASGRVGGPVEAESPPIDTSSPTAEAKDDQRAEEGRSHDQPVVPPSLPWRFLGWLGGLTITLQIAREMILKRDPHSTCHREKGSVDPFKARSEQRLRTLERARQLILIMPEFEGCFDRPLFPQFATRAGFG